MLSTYRAQNSRKRSVVRRCCLGLCTGCLLLVGCATLAHEPSPARFDCLQRCSRWKDECILHATNAARIEYCDGWAKVCSEECPQ